MSSAIEEKRQKKKGEKERDRSIIYQPGISACHINHSGLPVLQTALIRMHPPFCCTHVLMSPMNKPAFAKGS